VDLTIEVPALLLGGILIWRRTPLGYAAGAGLLLQFGLTPLALASGMVLQGVVTDSGVDLAVVGVLAFAIVAFAPLVYFGRARKGESEPAPQPRASRRRCRPA
jgi:hypothetical protein